MGGVDFSGEPSEIDATSFAYVENMYRDWGTGGCGIETVPGFRKLLRLPAGVHALHPHPREEGAMLLHAGRALYPFSVAQRDAGGVPAPLGGAALAEGESRGEILDGRLFLVDGERYTATDGTALAALDEDAYVPLLFSDGEPLEQKNLLSERGDEEYHLFLGGEYAFSTSEGLSFCLSPEGNCLIDGYTGSDDVLILPSRARLGMHEYAVAGIKGTPFVNNQTVKTLILSDGISEIPPAAFYGMRALTTLVLPPSVTVIPMQCFEECTALTTLYLPRELAEIGSRAFRNVPVLTLHLAGTRVDLLSAAGSEYLLPSIPPNDFAIHEGSRYPTVRLSLPVISEGAALLGVSLNGTPLRENAGEVFYRPLYEGEGEGRRLCAVYLEAAREELIYSKTVRLSLSLADAFAKEHGDELGGASAVRLVNSATLLARYDGRLFLSGFAAMPGLVLYTARRQDGVMDPSYLGELCYFRDGDRRTPVRALLATPTSLLVFTAAAPSLPSLYLHTGVDTGDDLLPRIYPAEAGLGGVGCLGGATYFLGEALFLSERGLEAVGKHSLSEERTLLHRSGAVDTRLLHADLAGARFFRFGSYLGINAGGEVFLADGRRTRTRDGVREYEWFYLSGIGTHRDDLPRYRFLTGECPEELVGKSVTQNGKVLPLATADTEGYADGLPLFSCEVDGIAVSYTPSGGKALLVSTDGERYGGIFSPATAFYECRDLLFFGTDDGHLAVFNTDKRETGGIIPRRYYTFADHAYLSGCATKLDDCGISNRRKTTVRSGGAVRLKAMTGGKLEVRVRTEDGVFTVADTLFGGRGDFGEVDFTSAEFHTGEDTVVPLREAKRRWVEKQLYFVSEEYQRPFGLLSVTYQYRVAGRI